MLVWVLGGLCVLLALTTVSLLVARSASVRDGEGASPSEPTGPPRPSPGATDHLATVESMDTGVLILRTSLSPVYANGAARRLLHLPPMSLPATLEPADLSSIARRALNDGRAEGNVTLWPERREVRVQAQVDDHERVNVFLSDITDEARALQVRRQFVVNASHELKTPVAGMQALAEAVEHAIREDDAQEAKRFAIKLQVEAERLTRLVQDLLDLSRLEDPAHFSDVLVDAGAVAEKESNQFRSAAEEARISLSTDVLPDAFVRGDEQQLATLFRNLIENAMQATPPGGEIHVRVIPDEDEVVLEVEDNGAGIPLNAQSRVFERFFRVDEGRARGSGGTGLGLSIVKHVAELHGGHVSVKSVLGEGSTFRVRLPIVTELE